MRKTIWSFALIALGTAGACESPLDGDDNGGTPPGRGSEKDPGLATEDGKGCSEGSLDAAGCACEPGAPPRSCFSGTADHAGRGACTYGSQICETTKGSEFDSSAWGPCQGSVEAAAETCGNGLDDDCNGTVDDCGGTGDSNGGDCCGDRKAECLASGASASTCATLETICDGGSCDGLIAACDPTSLPVSAQCANAYYRCFGFRVNKCMREQLAGCVGTIGDQALCEAWDAACAAREGYCADLLGYELGCGEAAPCGPKRGDDGKGNGGIYSYYCTDWGHIFDPCWNVYEACAKGPDACLEDLAACAGTVGDIYVPLCGDGDNGLPDGSDKGEPPKP